MYHTTAVCPTWGNHIHTGKNYVKSVGEKNTLSNVGHPAFLVSRKLCRSNGSQYRLDFAFS